MTIPLKLFIYINPFCETYTKPKTWKLYIRNEKKNAWFWQKERQKVGVGKGGRVKPMLKDVENS